MHILLNLDPVLSVRAIQFKNRVLVCQTQDNLKLNVFYPGSTKHMPQPSEKYEMIVKNFQSPRKVCSHYLVAGDARVHANVKSSTPVWIGFTTLYNNLIFKKILDLNLWVEEVSSYKTEVKLKSSRIDFYIPNTKSYMEIKADFVLWFKLKESRFLKHLTLLNEELNSKVVFIAPYGEQFSALENPLYAQKLNFLKSFKNISYYWIYISYDKKGAISLNKIKKL